MSYIEKIKTAQAFAHLPLRSLGEGITDDYESGDDDDAIFYAALECWESNGGGPQARPEPNLQPGPAQEEEPELEKAAEMFLESVLPWNVGGYTTIHWLQKGGNFFGRSCQTIDAALQLVAELKATQFDIYFCISSQKLNSGKRSRNNAIGLQVVPVDIDVKPDKTYSTLEEASDALFQFCDGINIPRPSFLVASGGGLHAYWLSDRVLTVEEWQPFADALKTAAKAAGLKIDAACTGDAARVLRVPSTTNWKQEGNPRPVYLLQGHCTGIGHDFAVVFKKILDKKTVQSSRLNKEPIPVAEAFKRLDPRQGLGQGIEPLPPLPFEPIKEECGWLRHVHETGGADQDEQLWRDALRVCMFLEQGESLIHEFSKGHAEYDVKETEAKFERARKDKETNDLGYPKCQTICDHGSAHCKTCPHFPEGKSPLNLGLQQPPSAEPVPPREPVNKPPWMVELGSKLWGTAKLYGKEYRFGEDQSKVIDPIKGMWFDFAANRGGSIRELMKKVATVANREQPNADDVVVICAADVTMRPLDWLWEGHLLRGSQELLSGLPDLSKSTVQINYIACATARLPWPDGAPAIEPTNVVMLTAEDTLEQIVVPRLRAAGADVSRVSFLKCIKTDEHDRQFLLAEDLDRLECLVRKIGNVGLITIDPITAYMGGRMDSHKATEVRAQLGPLKDFSERMNIALSTITHPPKAAGHSALNHFIGSQAFIAACRVGHLCVAEMEEKDGEYIPTGRILFTNVRNTAYRQRMPTLAYRKVEVIVGTVEQGFERPVTAPQIAWEGPVDITADAAVAAASGKKSDQQPKVQAFLREMLKEGKPVPQKEIEDAAIKKGFTDKQLRTAREKLGVHVNKEPGKMDGGWLWQLPDFSDGKYYY